MKCILLLLWLQLCGAHYCTFSGISQFHRLYPLYQVLEDALTSNSENLYLLKQVFFPSTRTPIREANVAYFSTCIQFNTSEQTNCLSNNQQLPNTTEETLCSRHCYDFRWTVSPLLNLITVDQLLAFDNVFTDLTYSSIGTSIRYNSAWGISLVVPLFPCIPTQEDLMLTLSMLLSWAKAYARDQGKPVSWKDEDRGYLSKRYDYWVTNPVDSKSHKIRQLLLYTFIGLNIFIPLTIAIVAADFYDKLSQKCTSPQTVSYIWAGGLVMVIHNLAYFCVSLPILIDGKPFAISCLTEHCVVSQDTELYRDDFAAFVAKLVILTIAVPVELIVAIRVPNNSQLSYPPLLSHCNCKCYKSSWCCKILQTIFLWNLFLFVQIWGGLVILPVVIFTIIAPVATIQVISIAAFVMLFFLVMFASALQIEWNKMQRSHWKIYILKLAAATAFISLVIIVLILYNTVLDSGVSPLGIKHAILSLLPSLFISLLVWLLKKYGFKVVTTTDNEEINRMEEGVDLVAVTPNSEATTDNKEINRMEEGVDLVAVTLNSEESLLLQNQNDMTDNSQ